jgi:predicted DCC family thiol-disulfide oxidoreductase YuxK
MKTSVLLYDGECGLCDWTVQQLLKWDHHGRLKYAPLQSPRAQVFLRQHGLALKEFSTVIWVQDWNDPLHSEFRIRSAAVAAALKTCGGLATVLGHILHLLPKSVGDCGYDLVARNRLRWFGGVEACPLMKPEWRARFLDGR